jgi:cholesterol transport system auxiliary component
MMERRKTRGKEGKKPRTREDRKIGRKVALVFLLSLLVLAGCNSAYTANRIQYLLEPSRNAEAPAADQEAAGSQAANPKSENRVLEVCRFRIESAFAAKSLVYRVGPLRYETDFYNTFLVPPAVMIAEETRVWLSQSGLFSRVIGPGAVNEPTYVLEGDILELYGDLRDKTDPRAVMQIRFFLSRVEENGQPLAMEGKTYIAVSHLESADPAGLVEAFNRCFETILTDLEKDLAGQLS